ncbi:MAG: argininosuccinate lyase [Acidimicrobiia bacterium]|nr:MAG: argininosuccinate lyase [Acidimicrobiia bacterium]
MTLWSGGRFEEEPAEILWRFTVDTSDRRLLIDDVTGSIAHATMLGSVGLLTPEEATAMLAGLEAIKDEAETGSFLFLDTDEDVHSAVERRLGEVIGRVAGKLHTGRSRNDQIALDLRLYLRRSVGERTRQLKQFVRLLVDLAVSVGDTVVPSYTHLQQAQAVPLAHHLLAYTWMLKRDLERFDDASRRIDVSPLGAGASGGSSLPLDAEQTAALLGMAAVFDNSMDAVGSRDVAAEYVWCITQTMLHLSRLSEDLLLWSTREFGWVTFSDAFTTGSSAMPQKKNADIAELVRGKAATVVGDLAAIASLQKGLPMTYNRDLQEDKRVVFHADDSLAGSLDALGGMLSTIEFHTPAPSDWVTSLDLAEILVRRSIPFREAHNLVGALVTYLLDKGESFVDLTADQLTDFDPRFEPGDIASVDPVDSVQSRMTHGGGSMDSVVTQIEALEAFLGEN